MFPAWLLLIFRLAKRRHTCLSSQTRAGERPLGPIKHVYLKPHADIKLAMRLNHIPNVKVGEATYFCYRASSLACITMKWCLSLSSKGHQVIELFSVMFVKISQFQSVTPFTASTKKCHCFVEETCLKCVYV